MRFCFILENEEKFLSEIVTGLLKIDPELQIRVFTNLEGFVEWIKVAMQEGPIALGKAGQVPKGMTAQEVSASTAVELSLVIAKVEYLGARQFGLLQKTREFFVKKKICTAELPTSFVLTAFEDPLIKVKELRNRILANLIFKPFDPLILTQHLVSALDGHNPPSQSTFEAQKISSVIEVLKDVPLDGLSEIGLITRSSREIKPGSVSKYYGSVFYSETQKSLMSKVVHCRPHPQYPNEFQVHLHFFAADLNQVKGIRRRITNQSEVFPTDWIPKATSQRKVNFAVVDSDADTREMISEGLKRRFKNVEIVHYSHVLELQMELDPQSLPAESTPKAFEGGSELDIEMDLQGRQILSASQNNFLGVSVEQIKNQGNWFQSHLDAKSLADFRAWLQNPQSSVQLFLSVGDLSYFIKPSNYEKKPKQISLKLTELSQAERTAFIQSRGKMPTPLDFLISGDAFFTGTPEERWKHILELVCKRTQQATPPKLIMVSGKRFSDQQEREFAVYVDEIFFKPLDRVYFFKKILSLSGMLEIGEEPLPIQTIRWTETIKSANPVQISEINEAGLTMIYNRQLEIGEFREFILHQPYEIDAPELWAQCNYLEESQAEKGVFNCQFVFFGVSDSVLKSVRIWIRDNYIQSKEEG